MSSNQSPLIINDWQTGIADSPHLGFGLFKNVNIDAIKGSVRLNKRPGPLFRTVTTQTFTAGVGTDICTTSANVESDALNYSGTAVYFTTTGTLPAGLATGTMYFLYKVTNTTFQVCTSYKNSAGTAAGTVINITSAGSGVHTVNQATPGTIRHIVGNAGDSRRFYTCSKGRVWFEDNSAMFLLHNSALDTPASGVSNGNGRGLAITSFTSTTKEWLFVFRDATIDVMDVGSTATLEALTWSNSWNALNTSTGSTNSHEAIVGQDDAIYFCDDRYVGSIIEAAGSTFAPGTGSTYTYNNQALDLPVRENAQCLAEQGTYLMVGSSNTNKIYPWDRISNSFNIPIEVPESEISKIINVGGSVYILAGELGGIYVTEGTYASLFKKLPDYLVDKGIETASNIVAWGGLAQLNNSILFGVESTFNTEYSGLWRLFLDGRLVIEQVPSSGDANATAIYAKDQLYRFGYSGGADKFLSDLHGSKLVAPYDAIIQSPFYQLSDNISKATFSRMECVLTEAASSGNIRISYRTAFSDSFTTLDTYNLIGNQNVFSTEDIGLIDLENIQIQVEMGETTQQVNDLELLVIRFYP